MIICMVSQVIPPHRSIGRRQNGRISKGMNLIPAATTSIDTGLAQYSRENREVNPTLENQQEGESERKYYTYKNVITLPPHKFPHTYRRRMWRQIIKQRLRKLQLGQERRLAEPQNVEMTDQSLTQIQAQIQTLSQTQTWREVNSRVQKQQLQE